MDWPYIFIFRWDSEDDGSLQNMSFMYQNKKKDQKTIIYWFTECTIILEAI